jgi:hypothetical protein
MKLKLTLFTVVLLAAGVRAEQAPAVRAMRVPEGGIQPQVAMDGRGVVQMIYYKGDEQHGNIFYVRSIDGAERFSPPIRVNSQEGSALSIGTIRGAHLAVGKNGRVHVAWMGSQRAEPKPNGKGTPMLYSRLNDAGTAFEPQRNLIHEHIGLDGGGSVAADGDGNVYVAWHAPKNPKGEEADRRVWTARSKDDGQTFAAETAAWDEPTGACGCCGMKMFADSAGTTYALYRSATDMIHRDMYLLTAAKGSDVFTGQKVGPWKTGQCQMSSAAFGTAANGALAAWEQEGQIYWAKVSVSGVGDAHSAPGSPGNRKHPAVAGNLRGQTIVAWAEGTGWQKGGSIAWQVFEADGKPLKGAGGRAARLPVWSFPAAFADGEGFVVMY